MKRHLIIAICLCGTLAVRAQNYADCSMALEICNKQSLHLNPENHAGSDPTELNIGCFTNVGNPSVEYNSAWIRFTVAESGSFYFVASPDSVSDDLDFALFRLMGSSCNEKSLLRCMAAGSASYPSPCMGPTGLLPGQTDTVGPAGCDNNSDNFLAPLEVLAGETYVLAINNFSDYSGFTIDFCGTALLGCETDPCFQIAVATASQASPPIPPRLFPNPVLDELSIEFDANTPDWVEITFVNSIGREVPAGKLAIPAGISRQHINTMHLPAGWYVLRVKNQFSAYSVPFIKER